MRRTRRSIFVAVIVAGAWFAMPALAFAEPATASVPPTATTDIDSARERALELEEMIENYRAEQVAITERLAVTNQRIFQQQEILADSRARLKEARKVYADRMVHIYKSRTLDPVSILLAAESISDFYARAMMLGRIAERDHAAYTDAVIAASAAAYNAAALDDLKAQDLELKRVQTNRLDELARALEEQQRVVSRLTADALKALEALRIRNRTTRSEWIASSIPIGRSIPFAIATVQPHTERTYLVPTHQPRSYRSLGRVEAMVCSWYGPGFNGRTTASGQVFNEEDLTCASKTLPFGTRLALSFKGQRVIVVVNDRGPFIAGRDLDLSKAAARELGFSGVVPVEVEFIEPLP